MGQAVSDVWGIGDCVARHRILNSRILILTVFSPYSPFGGSQEKTKQSQSMAFEGLSGIGNRPGSVRGPTRDLPVQLGVCGLS